jgi:hypothetical protein
MGSRPNNSSSSSFYWLGALCCAYYITAQLIQELTFHFGINDCAVGELRSCSDSLAWILLFRPSKSLCPWS